MTAVFPALGYKKVEAFIDKVQQRKYLDVREYWEMREFASPGYFRKDIHASVASDTRFKELLIQYPFDNYTLLFTSQKLVSIGGLTTYEEAASLVNRNLEQTVVYSDQATVISTNNKKDIFITFMRPLSEMKKANGFLEKISIEDVGKKSYWLEIAKITH